MSRQRLRTGVLEGSTTQCPHCQGTGIIRSTESVALAVLRGLEDAVIAGARTLIATTTPIPWPSTSSTTSNPSSTTWRRASACRSWSPASTSSAGANSTIEGASPAQAPRRIERNVVDVNPASRARTRTATSNRASSHRSRRGQASVRPDRGGERSESSEEGARRRRRRRRQAPRREREDGNGRYADDTRSSNVEDVSGEDDADTHAQGGVEDAPEDHEHEREAGEPRQKKAKAAARASVADAAVDAVAVAAAADASATVSAAARRARAKWRQRAASSRRWPAGILCGRRAPRRRDHVRSPRSDHRLPQLACRWQRRSLPPGRCVGPRKRPTPQGGSRRSGPRSQARRRRAGAPASAWSASSSVSRSVSTEDASASNAPAQGVVAAQARRRVTSRPQTK